MKAIVKDSFILGGLMSLLVIAFVGASVSAKGSTGGVSDDHIAPGCGAKSLVCTTYGASWRYYTTSSNSVDVDGGRKYINSSRQNPGYVKQTIVKGCGAVGGYWRYAMVAQQSGKGYGISGDKWNKGEQIGTTSIGGSDPSFRAVAFNGPMKYIEWSGYSWNDVRDMYAEAKAAEPNTYKYNWNSTSNLAWFCYGPPFKMTVKARTYKKGQTIKAISDKTARSDYGGKISITRRTDDDWTFLYFVTNYKKREEGDKITRTKSGCEPYISNNGTTINAKGCTTGSSKTVYAIYKKKQFTLSATAVDTDGRTLRSNFTKSTVNKDSSAHVDRREYSTPSGYGFLGWAESLDNAKSGTYITRTGNSNSTYVSSNRNNYYVKKLSSNKTVYAVYGPRVTLTATAIDQEGNTLEAGFDSMAVTKGSTAHVGGSNLYSATGYTFVCWKTSPTGSCITRTSKSKATYVSSSRRTFYVKALGEDKTVYAVFSGTPPPPPPPPTVSGDCDAWTPSSYSSSSETSGTTSTVSKVKNISLEKYSDWNDVVYAKPKDEVNWIHCYYPGVQRTANTEVTTNHNNAEGNSSCSKWVGSCWSAPSYSLYTTQLHNAVSWSNSFSISSRNFVSDYNGQSRGFATGNDDVQVFKEDVLYDVAINNVGKKLDEIITTGGPKSAWVWNEDAHHWGCAWAQYGEEPRNSPEDLQPVYAWSDTCGHDEDFINKRVDPTPASSFASVLVPYNFENETELTSDDGVVNAGESTSASFDLITLPKWNDVTEDEYATRVDNAKYGLEICSDLGCFDTSDRIVNLNTGTSDTNYNDGDTVNKTITFSVPDVQAGSEVCIRSWVYPATSGDDTNYSDPGGNHERAYSPDSLCYTVAKKPSIQIWGGNIYTRGKISTILSKKNNVTGYASYVPDGLSRDLYVFGSFGENGLIASSGVTGFASGAATGYAAITNGDVWPNPTPADGAGNNSSGLYSAYGPGGSKERPGTGTTICIRSSLTFANSPCSGESVGYQGLNSATSTNNIDKDKDNVIAKFARNIEQNVSDTVSLNDSTKMQNDGTYYYYGGNDDLYIGGATLPISTIQMVHTNGDATIVGDIEYGDIYTALSQMPKLIIYADNIFIDCEVNIVDALLIARNKVVTCNSDNDINDPEFSRQLVINGAVVAKTLTPNRTYGAASGANSIVPAEIINFDPTLYLWGDTSGEDEGNGDKLDVAQIRELSPRQ